MFQLLFMLLYQQAENIWFSRSEQSIMGRFCDTARPGAAANNP